MESDGYGSLIVILAAVFKGFFTVCETAVTEIDDRKVRNGDIKHRGKDTLLKLLEKPAKLVTAFAVNRMLTAVIIAYAAFSFMPPLAGFFADIFSIDGEETVITV